MKVDRARAVLRRPKRTDNGKVATTRATTVAMEGASTWNQSPELQTAAARWKSAADALEKNAAKIADLKKLLAVAQAAQLANRRDWQTATQHVLALVTALAGGDAMIVLANGCDVQTRTKMTVEAPEIVGSSLGTEPGEGVLEWKCPSARNGYLVQTASDSKDASTYSHPVPCTRRSTTLRGIGTQRTTNVRVAAIDPASTTGIGPWSVWVPVMGR